MKDLNDNFDERNARRDIGEIRFSFFVKSVGGMQEFKGNDPKKHRIENFHLMDPFIRHRPDFIVNIEGLTNGNELAEAKGTPKIKKYHLEHYIEWGKKENLEVYVWFCFYKKDPIRKLAQEVLANWDSYKPGQYPDNDEEYRVVTEPGRIRLQSPVRKKWKNHPAWLPMIKAYEHRRELYKARRGLKDFLANPDPQKNPEMAKKFSNSIWWAEKNLADVRSQIAAYSEVAASA